MAIDFNLTPAEKITNAKIYLNKSNPFFAYIVAHMQIKEQKEGMPTAGVDARGNLFYNPDFIAKLSPEETAGVLCHETMHTALLHMPRYGKRVRHLFNVACDLVVNNMIVHNNSGGLKLPQGTLIPQQDSSYEFTSGKTGKQVVLEHLDKKSAEEVYDELLKHINIIKIHIGNCGASTDKNGNYNWDFHIESDEGDSNKDKKGKGKGKAHKDIKESLEDAQKEWGKVMAEAHNYARQQGNVPAGIERYIEGLLKSKHNWKALLQKFITAELPFNFTYSRPSRKSVSTGVYMPSLKKESVEIAVAIDTSGSIQQKELQQFLSEVVAIGKSHDNLKMTLITCDCEINDVCQLSNGNMSKVFSLKIGGGGGTSFFPVFQYFEKKAKPKLLIYLTDGYGDCPDNSDIKTLWIIAEGGSDAQIKFGTKIKI